MSPRSLSLAELVRSGTFRARTQHRILGESPDLPWELFALVQQRYRAAPDDPTRRAVATDFERLVREAHEEAGRLDAAGEPPPDAFTLGHFRAWAADLVLDTGEPWILEPFQARFVEDLFAGFPECWLILPEGNTKTTTIAGLALYHCEFRSTAFVPVAASSREQAEWVYRQAEGFVLRSARLKAIFRCQEGYRRIKSANGSRIQVFAADDKTGDGVIPTLALVDELHRHKDLRLYRLWRGKLPKRGGQLVTISTAGEPGSEFEETRAAIRQSATDSARDGSFLRAVASGALLHEWAVLEDGDTEDIATVKAANPFSGITVDQLREKRDSPTMTVEHWRRFVCNLPTRSGFAAIAEKEWFDAGGVEIPAGEEIWAGLDCGWRWDTTALAPLWMPDLERRILGPATILVPPRDGTSLDLFEIERALGELHARNPIHTLVMDLSDARDVAEWAAAELGCRVVEHGTGLSAQVADYEAFMEALRNGWLHHSGDQGLTRHVLNAVARVLPRGDAIFARPAEGRRSSAHDLRVIDALVAAAMVHQTAVAEAAATPVASWKAF